MKGRKPKPTGLRLIEGNREHRTISKEEPRPAPIAPPCPRELQGDERKAWRYLVREMGKMGTLASSDRGQMTAYCDAWGRWVKGKRKLRELAQMAGNDDIEVIRTGAKRKVNPDGSTVETGGNWIQNPWLNFTNRALEDVVKYGAELGLNPVQRTRVKVERSEPNSRRSKLLA
jgi:P27 family predicted phage terminase small subunit